MTEIKAQEQEVANEAKNEKVWDDGAQVKATQEARGISSIVVSLFPGIGEGYDITTLLSGQDPLTKETLSTTMKAFTVVGLLSGLGSGSAARKVGKESIEKLAKELGMSVDELMKIAEDVAKEYKMSSIDDIKALKGKLTMDGFVNVVKGKALKVKISRIQWSKVAKPDLGKISNIKLKELIENNYKSTSKIGNGSTADAIRYTKATGELVGEYKPSDHIQKGNDTLQALQKRFNANDLNEYDKKIAMDIFNDITNALNGK